MAPGDDPPHPVQWHTTNLVGVPTGVLAGTAFQAHPVPLSIAGARAAHRRLFALLAECAEVAQAREVFVHYTMLAFGLQPDATAALRPSADGRRRFRRASYLRLMQGWGLDANGTAGAVLKGWVESRFGLTPWFHRAALARFPSPAWVGYLEAKAHPRWHNNNLYQQLDLLFEYAQWMLGRFALLGQPGDRHVMLWRGSSQVDEQLVAGSLRERHCTVRLNNIVSLALTPEDAGCFGDWVFRIRVPRCKLLVVPGLLPATVLQGEGEVIAIGGDHVVEARYAA